MIEIKIIGETAEQACEEIASFAKKLKAMEAEMVEQASTKKDTFEESRKAEGRGKKR